MNRLLNTSVKVLTVMSILAIPSCGKFLKRDHKKDDLGSNANREALDFSMPPLEKDKIRSVLKIEKGNYVLVRINTKYVEDSKDKFLSLFQHDLAKPGDMAENDRVQRFSDFSKVSDPSETYYPATELNLVQAFSIDGKGIEFEDVSYYWNQNISNGGWGWSLSPTEHSARVNPFSMMKKALKADVNAEVVDEETRYTVMIVQNAELVEVYVKNETTRKDGSTVEMSKLTYKRK